MQKKIVDHALTMLWRVARWLLFSQIYLFVFFLSYLDEPHFKTKKSKKKKQLTINDKSSLGIIDEEELEHLQSDVDEEEEKEGSITSDLDDEVQGISVEPLYVLPLYAILSSEKQARVCLLSLLYFHL
jgi:hypothetical protein